MLEGSEEDCSTLNSVMANGGIKKPEVCQHLLYFATKMNKAKNEHNFMHVDLVNNMVFSNDGIRLKQKEVGQAMQNHVAQGASKIYMNMQAIIRQCKDWCNDDELNACFPEKEESLVNIIESIGDDFKRQYTDGKCDNDLIEFNILLLSFPAIRGQILASFQSNNSHKLLD